MKIYCRNTISGLRPLYNSDHDEKKRLKIGVDYQCDIRVPRNLGYHKRFFAMLNIGYQNTRFHNMTFEAYRSYVTMKAGYYQSYTTSSGVLILPESISFASMDQDQFEKLHSSVMDVILQDIGIERDELLEEILNFM